MRVERFVEESERGDSDGENVLVVPAHFGQFFKEIAEAAKRGYAFSAACDAGHHGCPNREF